jgi:hypothetical protein
MNSVGRWPIFFFISYYSYLPNTSPKVHKENSLFAAIFPGPVLMVGGAGRYAGLPSTSTRPQTETCSGGRLGSGPAQ